MLLSSCLKDFLNDNGNDGFRGFYGNFLVFAVVYAVGFAVVFCVFFFSCSSQSVIWFRPLFLLLMFVFCFLFFSLFSFSELLPLTKNNAFTFWGWCIHCLASLGRFFLNQNPFRFAAIRFLFFGQIYPTAMAFNYLLIATSQILL